MEKGAMEKGACQWCSAREVEGGKKGLRCGEEGGEVGRSEVAMDRRESHSHSQKAGCARVARVARVARSHLAADEHFERP